MEGNFKSLPSEIETEKDKLVLWVVTLFLYKIGICWQQIPDSIPHLTDQTKDYKIGICCISAKHSEVRSKDMLTRSE